MSKFKVIHFQNNKFTVDNEENSMSDLFSNETFVESEKVIPKINCIEESYLINEMYINFIQPYVSVRLFLEKNINSKVKFIGRNSTINKAYIYDNYKYVAFNRRKMFCEKLKWFFVKITVVPANIIMSFFYLFVILIFQSKSKNIVNNKVCVNRTKAAKKNTKVMNGFQNIDEKFTGKSNIYSYVNVFIRYKALIKALIKSLRALRSIRITCKAAMGWFTTVICFLHYSKRIIHTYLYRLILEEFLLKYKITDLLSGNNLDRFALIEEEVCKDLKIRLTIIPHGIEYGFKLPHCFTGNIFYTTSNEASNRLNTLYNTSKFVFSDTIMKKIYSVKPVGNANEFIDESSRKIVFYTEPREININKEILNGLIQISKKRKFILYIKLHPSDDLKNYKDELPYLKVIENYDKAIFGNICIARKSSVLLESLYNCSIPIAIITNQKDKLYFDSFPSLNQSSIHRFTSTDEFDLAYDKIFKEEQF
jgi:hypothetical protein